MCVVVLFCLGDILFATATMVGVSTCMHSGPGLPGQRLTTRKRIQKYNYVTRIVYPAFISSFLGVLVTVGCVSSLIPPLPRFMYVCGRIVGVRSISIYIFSSHPKLDIVKFVPFPF